MPEEKKKFNKQDYDNNYIKKKYDRINLTMPKGTKKRIEEAAKASGASSTAEFIRVAIEHELEKLLINKGISNDENN